MKIKNKVLLCSGSFLLVILGVQHFFPKFRLIRFQQRKCVPYKPLQFDITFSHRKECLKSVHQSQSAEVEVTNLNTIDEIITRGYNASSHTFVSKDGYYSSIYRISGGVNSPPRNGKRAILMYHGFLATGASWIIQPGSRNLAFTLVNAGYDVWLANSRGTTPSKKHRRFDADKDLDYWNFGSVELSQLDLPQMIDLILQETGTDKLYYVCHSMGCAVLFTGLADLPELNNKIEANFLLAPPTHMGSSYNPTFLLFPPISGTPLQDLLFRFMGGRINGEPNALLKALGLSAEKVCGWSFMRCGICDNLIFAMFGADPEQMDYNNFPNIVRMLTNTGALKPFFHGLQVNEACAFQRNDYGTSRNLLEYGSSKPPRYNLTGITVPTYIFYSENDNFVTPWDAERVRDAIPEEFMRGFYKVGWHKFNHIDFLMAKDADILLYHKIRDIIMDLEQYNECHLQGNEFCAGKSQNH